MQTTDLSERVPRLGMVTAKELDVDEEGQGVFSLLGFHYKWDYQVPVSYSESCLQNNPING